MSCSRGIQRAPQRGSCWLGPAGRGVQPEAPSEVSVRPWAGGAASPGLEDDLVGITCPGRLKPDRAGLGFCRLLLGNVVLAELFSVSLKMP